jgi:LppX_LprAFG lipoprotein
MRRGLCYLPVVVAALLLAAVLLSVPGCGGGATQADPNAVLSGSVTKMKQVTGFHVVYEVHKPSNTKPGSGLEIVRITGDVNAAGDMKAAIDVTQDAVPLTLNFVQVGDTQYLQMGTWQTIPVESSPVGKLSLGKDTVAILQQVAGAAYVGQDTKGGAKCYHVTGSVAAEAVKAIAQSVDVTTPFPADLWIGVSDGYIYEVDIHGPATADEPAGTWRSIILSKFNVSVDIKAPI